MAEGHTRPIVEATKGRLPLWVGLADFSKHLEMCMFQELLVPKLPGVLASCRRVGFTLSLTLVPTPPSGNP